MDLLDEADLDFELRPDSADHPARLFRDVRRQLEDRIDAIREDQRREREEAAREREREVLRYKPSYLRRLLKREPWRRAQLLDELHAAGVVDETGRFVDESSKGANPS